jgi:hypothetical protein
VLSIGTIVADVATYNCERGISLLSLQRFGLRGDPIFKEQTDPIPKQILKTNGTDYSHSIV